MKDCFENCFYLRKNAKLVETDRGKQFYNIIFQNSPNRSKIKSYSRNTNLGAVFGERFNRTSREFPKTPVFEKGVGNWVNICDPQKQNIIIIEHIHPSK